ncbi:hypothetical protein ACFU76_23125 [Streptomyces sp. NPDC057539]|uniref:hypothetical protein n=1 Tax=Streptomyces sp. NPDC057539 TaxID=3346159 RepID=UPI0036BC1FDA
MGRTLRIGGFVLGAGAGAGLAGPLVSDPGPEIESIPLALRLLVVASVVIGGWLVFYASHRLLVRGKQHLTRTVTSFEQLKGERYVLYLRPFVLDSRMATAPPETPGIWSSTPYEVPGLTTEEFLTRQFADCGRVVAVGQPGERLPLLGAQRGYLPLNGWQNTVSQLIQGAHAVLMSVAPGPGTVWEYTEALRTIPPERLVLMVCCGSADYDAFRTAAAQKYAARRAEEGGNIWAPLPALPDCPVHAASKRDLALPLRAFVTFDEQWKPCLLRFTIRVPRQRHAWTVRRAVRRQLQPVVEPLTALPQQQPTAAPPFPAASTPVSGPKQPLLGSVLPQRAVRPRGRRNPRRGLRRK